MIADYIKPAVEKMLDDIVEGIEAAKCVISLSDEQILESLQKQYVQYIGYVNGLRNCDVEDKHRIKLCALRAAINKYLQVQS